MLIHHLNYNMNSDESEYEVYDSDGIDSDVEAELYSTIHHNGISTEPDVENKSSINIISVDSKEKECRDFKENVSVLSLRINLDKNVEMPGKNNKVTNKNKDLNLKRKSNVVADILNNIQIKNESPRKKQKTDNCKNQTRNTESSLDSDIIEIIDSDSSVILSEPDEATIRKLQTNVETVYVTSESEISENDTTAVNFNHSSDEVNENYRGVWQINSTDMFRTKRTTFGRYYLNAVSTCSNCNKKGHIARNCTERKVLKCFICGGVHSQWLCKRRICFKCLRFGHDSRRCYFPVDNIICGICNMRGHAGKCCPDLWRRYHLTTAGDKITKGRFDLPSRAYCSNCGIEGHFGFQCAQPRMDRWTYPTSTAVVSYEHPALSLGATPFQRNMNVQENVSGMQQPRIYSQQPQIRMLQPQIHSRQPQIHMLQPQIHSQQQPQIHSQQQPQIHSQQQPQIHSQQPQIHMLQPQIHSQQPQIHILQPQIHTQQPIPKTLQNNKSDLTRREKNKQKKMKRKLKRAATFAALQKNEPWIKRGKNSNVANENVRRKQEVNFPRSPKGTQPEIINGGNSGKKLTRKMRKKLQQQLTQARQKNAKLRDRTPKKNR